jgi:hypothetical protein
MDRSILAAIARFPDRGHASVDLARADESFRVLCADLADAEEVLRRFERSSSPVQQAHCADYRELVRDLAVEIEQALDRWL